MKRRVYIREILNFLRSTVVTTYGQVENKYIDNVADLEHTNKTTLDWVNNSKINKQEIAEGSVAEVIIADPEVVYSEVLEKASKTLIIVLNPRMAIAKTASEFFLKKDPGMIHPSAIVDGKAEIDPTAFIGPGCIIGKAKIGAGTSLKASVVVYDDVEIGDYCLIQAGAIIGTDGLGCQREPDGKLVKFPHLGGIMIGNNVEIGANCQIAKGVLSDTIIKDGCKMNGLCFIAHNCILEENVWITGNTMLCGSVHVGKNTTIFSNVIIRDQVYIGENTVIGMGSVVTKNVPDGETWFGSPAHKKE